MDASAQRSCDQVVNHVHSQTGAPFPPVRGEEGFKNPLRHLRVQAVPVVFKHNLRPLPVTLDLEGDFTLGLVFKPVLTGVKA